MASEVKFTDNSAQIKAQMDTNVPRALAAMGIKAVALTVNKMQSGYGKPIRITGDLMRDVSSEVGNDGENTVSVGNSITYAPHVHDGTWKMQGRPYLRDAIMEGTAEIQAAAEAPLKEGFT